MTVSGDSLVTMGAYKELPIKGPHNLFNTAKDSLSYRSKDADSRIHLYYTPVEDVLRLDIEQMVGDTIYKASGTAPFTRK